MLTVIKDKYILFLAIYTFILLFFCSQFSYLFGDFNQWTDVNIYYTIGKSIFLGKVPYRDLFDHKGPIIFFLYGLGYKITPDSFQGMFFLQLIFLSTALIFVYRLSNLFINKLFSFFSACIFLNCLFYFNSSGGSPEEFVLLFMVISLYFFIKQSMQTDVTRVPVYYMFAHGVLLSATFFIKLNLTIFWFFPLLAIFINVILSKDYKILGSYIIMFFSGLLIVALPIFLYFIFNNALHDFIESYFNANYIYGGIYKIGIKDLVLRILVMLYKLTKFNFISSFFILLGVIYFSFSRILRKIFYKIAIFLSFCSLLTTIFISSFFVHYYFVVCTVFVPLGVISIVLIIRTFIKEYDKNLILLCSIFILLFSFYSIQKKDFFGYSTEELKTHKFDLGSIDVFSNIINNSTDKSLICLGMDYNIGVFTKAKIIPSQKYFFSPNFLMDQYPIIYDSMSTYIKNHEVKYIVLSDEFVFLSSFYDEIIDNSYKPISKVGIYTLYEYSK